MQKIFNSNKKPFNLSFEVVSLVPTKMKIQAFDRNKPYSNYYNTAGSVDQTGRKFDLTFPISPDELVVRIFPDTFHTYQDYVQFSSPAQKAIAIKNTETGELKTTPIWLSQGDLEFIRFAKWFAQNASIFSATQPNGIPSIYKSDNGKFEIHYFNKIKDSKTGQYVNTPARIGHNSGIIEVSKSDFLNYSIPGRFAILMHEYAHKYINEKTGLKVSDEIGADINALNIYLSLGFSPLEAHMVFLDVFQHANNPINHKRYKVLTDFIHKFTTGQLKQYYKTIN